MISENRVNKGFYITFTISEKEFHCTGKLFMVDDPITAIEEFKSLYPTGIFLGMLYKEL